MLPCCSLSQMWNCLRPDGREIPDNNFQLSNNTKHCRNSRKYQWCQPEPISSAMSFRNEGSYRNPTMWQPGTPVSRPYLGRISPECLFPQKSWKDHRDQQAWMSMQQEDHFNQLKEQFLPMQRMQASDPNLPKYSEINRWGPEEMLFSAYRPPFNQWRTSSAATEITKKGTPKKRD